MATDPLKKLLGIPDAPDPAKALAILAPNQFQSDVLQRGTSALAGGGPDFTPSVYNRELEAQNTETHADEDKRLKDRAAAENAADISALPNVAAETEKEQGRKLALAGEPNRVAGVNELANEKQKQEPLMKLLDGQSAGGGISAGGFQLKPTISENGVSLSAVAPDKLNTNEQQLVDSAHAINSLGVPLLQKFAAKYPGIDQDPSKYGSPISDTLTENLGKGIYSFGGMTDRDELLQESAAIQAWGVRALSQGRINKGMMDMITAHLPQPGFSPGANYDRLNRLLTDILPSQLQGISEGRGAGALSLPTSGGDPYSDPNYQPK